MKYVYWDSCCFLSYLEGDARGEQLVGIAERAQLGELKIVTSALTLTEVLGKRNATPAARDRIRRGMSAENGILFVDLTENLAKKARDFIWDHDYRNHRADAVHIATAFYFDQLKGIDEIHSFDHDLLKFGSTLGIPIVEPSLDQYPELQKPLPFEAEPSIER